MSGLIVNRLKEMEMWIVLKNPSGFDKLINESHMMLILALFILHIINKLDTVEMAFTQMQRFGKNVLNMWPRSTPMLQKNTNNMRLLRKLDTSM